MTWPGRVLVLDTETTGIDVFNDRIVQLFIGIADGNGDLIEQYEWLIDPGIEVPEEASNVHGFTTEFLRENGHNPLFAFDQAGDVFTKYAGIPWVAFNLNYDLSILDAEFFRNGISNDFGQAVRDRVQLIDGLVIDRAKDKWRKGKRKLANMAEAYGIDFDPEALHNAAADVELTAKVTRAIVNKHGMMTNAEQADAYRTWAVDFEKYLRRNDPEAVVDHHWPLRLKEEA